VWINYELGYRLMTTPPPRRDEVVRFLSAARAARPEVGHRLAHALEHRGDTAEAEALFRELCRLRPDNYHHHRCLGHLLREQKQLDEAIRELGTAIALDPKDEPAHSDLGLALLAQGKPEEAAQEFREAIRIDPTYHQAHYALGNLLQGKGKAAEAEAEYREALRLRPDFAETHTNLGGVLHDQGKPGEAEKEYREALRLKPDLPQAHYNLGNLLYGQGKPAEAEKEYREAIRLNPDYPEAHCNLGHLLRDQGRFREALDELRRGDELGSPNPRWNYPSAAWVENCRRLVEFDALLPTALDGRAEPADADAALGFDRVCRITKRHAAAARLWAAVMDVLGAASDPRTGVRYNAARSAALAGCGQGADAPAEDAERARLRAQALDWLRADLALWTKRAAGEKPDVRALVQQTLKHWQEDADLAGLRDKDAVSKLPADEQEAWKALWSDVDDLYKRTREAK
jgi:tetratricopeptide (TPR) repeat protein